MNLFARNAAKLTLTPLERAVLQFLQGLAISALTAGATAAFPYLSGTTPDLATVARVFAIAAVASLLNSLLHYAKAFGDPPLPGPSGAPVPPQMGT
jgi:hypothetical protein